MSYKETMREYWRSIYFKVGMVIIVLGMVLEFVIMLKMMSVPMAYDYMSTVLFWSQVFMYVIMIPVFGIVICAYGYYKVIMSDWDVNLKVSCTTGTCHQNITGTQHPLRHSQLHSTLRKNRNKRTPKSEEWLIRMEYAKWKGWLTRRGKGKFSVHLTPSASTAYPSEMDKA